MRCGRPGGRQPTRRAFPSFLGWCGSTRCRRASSATRSASRSTTPMTPTCGRHATTLASATRLCHRWARFRLKSGYDISSYGTEAKVVLTAFKHYGLIVADNGSDWVFPGTEDASWDDQIISDLQQ